MNLLKQITLIAALLPGMAGLAQSRDVVLNIEVTSVEGDNLQGQPISVTQTDYSAGYGNLKLDADGKCHLNIYAGNHLVEINRDGFEPLSETFNATSGETIDLKLALTEATRTPYALTTETSHDVNTGKDAVKLTWNTEKPVFFDDFESFSPFAIQFGDWTGIDGDGESTAALVGNYPNRGVLQYAQIINPLTVVPTWWYDYPVLRPYSGQQYAGFIRTSSGNTNDDWLISPALTPGKSNVLEFMAKAADVYLERFMVYVTETLDNPRPEDFVRIDPDNFETVDYKAWKTFSYDLSAYEGKPIKFAIRYISDANRYGAFMLMIDDVYVGQKRTEEMQSMARRIQRSPANPNETFVIYLDGETVGSTDTYTYTFHDVPAGNHTLGISAKYLHTQSETATIDITTGDGNYAHLTINVTADSKLSPEGTEIKILGHDDAVEYTKSVTNGKVEWISLPQGKYDVSVDEGAYNAYIATVDVTGDMNHDVALTDKMIAPYNITAKTDDEGNVILGWNRSLIFNDSFEDYEDFATGQFGDWISIDNDKQPVYPIGLGSLTNIVSFPGSGVGTNPSPIAPIVFNPWHTVPPMLPTDPAIQAPTGDKTIVFFSPQMAQADKWLISPLQEIREGYEVKFLAKAYSIYPESLEICVSDGSVSPADFTPIAEIDEIMSQGWGEYTVDLSDYAGQNIRIALHYTAYDAFLTQVDDFTVGPKDSDGMGEVVDYGNVVKYSVYLDDQLVGEPVEPAFTITSPAEGEHTVDIYADYLNGRSEKGSITIGETNSVVNIETAVESNAQYLDMLGRKVSAPADKGIYIRKSTNGTVKEIR